MKRGISGIYAIVNTVNGKRYYGSSNDIAIRKNRHFYLLRRNRHANPHLQSAWNVYGESAFQFEIVVECEESQLLGVEQTFLDSNLDGYNIVPRADRKRMSAESRRKMSLAKKGKPGRRGWKMSAEARRKVSDSNRGRTPHNRGKQLSPECRQKISVSNRGRKCPPRTPSHCAKIATNKRAWWAARRAEDVAAQMAAMRSKKQGVCNAS